jgi:hypothetical protein
MKNPFNRIALCVVLALVLQPFAARADGKTRVAVRSFVAKGVDLSVAQTLETSFCTSLSEAGYDVLCPDDVKALIASKATELGTGACDSDEECVRNIVKASNAARVVNGEVSRLGDTFIISVAMIDAKTGSVVARATEKTNKLEMLLDKVGPLASKLGGK